MGLKISLIILVGLSLFVIGLILPFIDVFMIKYYGKAVESLGSFILFASLGIFVAGVIITLIGFHKQNKSLTQ
ncbi:MAG: hypothetical protein BJBARM4_0854 [Candidatus Parvarchaeum acidiphilum ARMAN-4]|jgi:TM2 domain-containing membrane protein YozV|uniref:Uncharacterized protein n=1 Tax=Candidatus Parvarchaeum acidiphilum ARMAN-4 TaxID=662760 RepID=D2EGF5_PARA4|nr:MAG: hypothetical protein BJBARM4_0854 [Candidatus Parvarchaeum acidiphilum ARMAN-4]